MLIVIRSLAISSLILVYGGAIEGFIRTREIIGFALPELVIFGERNNLRDFCCAILQDKNHRKKARRGIELIR
jgi:hypothetical protein